MKEVYGNFWDLISNYHVGFLTTNMTETKAGDSVMGRGIAYEAKCKFPGISKQLAKVNREHREQIRPLVKLNNDNNTVLCNFTVKFDWYDQASLMLIKKSATQVKEIAEKHPDKLFLLPRPGVGNGKRSWDTEVKPLLTSIKLPDNVHIVTFKKGE